MSSSAKPTAFEKSSIEDLIKQKDAFLSTSERIYEFVAKHAKALITIGVLIVALALALVFYFNHQKNLENEALNALDLSWALADNGDNEAAIAALEKVRVDFSQRKAARLAAFKLFNLYAEKDQAKALVLGEELLSSLNSDEAPMKNDLLYALASLYEDQGNLDKAAASLQSASVGAKDEFKLAVLLSQGRVYKALGKNAEAQVAYENIINEFGRSSKAYLARHELALLGGDVSALAPVNFENKSAAVATEKPVAPEEPISVIEEDDLPPQ